VPVRPWALAEASATLKADAARPSMGKQSGQAAAAARAVGAGAAARLGASDGHAMHSKVSAAESASPKRSKGRHGRRGTPLAAAVGMTMTNPGHSPRRIGTREAAGREPAKTHTR